MLTENQSERVWEKMISAEVRGLYFADLAARYVKRKQIITGITFFLSSGAAVSVAAQLTLWVPLAMSSVAALLTAYSIAVGLDKKATTMANLYATWASLSAEYNHLWNHWYEEDAESRLGELLRRGREASEKGCLDAPHIPRAVEKWQCHVNGQYGLGGKAA